MGSSKPSMVYNAVRNRWEVVGKGGSLKAYFGDDGSFHMEKGKVSIGTSAVLTHLRGFTGSSAALAALTLGQVGVGTITNVAGLLRGDFVFGNPAPAISSSTTCVISNLNVPSNGLLNFQAACVATGGGSLPAMGWNIFHIRQE